MSDFSRGILYLFYSSLCSTIIEVVAGFVSDGDPMARPADWGASRAPAADWGAPREIPDDQELATYANMPEKDATAPL